MIRPINKCFLRFYLFTYFREREGECMWVGRNACGWGERAEAEGERESQADSLPVSTEPDMVLSLTTHDLSQNKSLMLNQLNHPGREDR